MIGEEMRAFLVAMPGVNAEIDERLYPSPLPQGTTLPAVTYQDISDVPELSNDNETCYSQKRYQVDAWANEREEAARVAKSVISVMHGYAGQWGAHDIGLVKRENGHTDYETATKLWRYRSDFMIHVLS
jgi:hypothetical protein